MKHILALISFLLVGSLYTNVSAQSAISNQPKAKAAPAPDKEHFTGIGIERTPKSPTAVKAGVKPEGYDNTMQQAPQANTVRGKKTEAIPVEKLKEMEDTKSQNK